MEIIRKAIKKNFDVEIDKDIDFEITNEKIRFFKKDLRELYEHLKLKGLRLERLGIYFGKLKKGEKIHLNIEGSQFVGKKAKKNVLNIDDYKTLINFLLGKVTIKEFQNVEKHNFPIVKYKDYIICSAASTENEIKSLFPKAPKKSLWQV